ncbi:hypothetical protein [Paenibacillus sp. 32O-W]|uniref:hypothetical protein n=1 Tax=Paenibacillus sp. 32O-W TaxID=1695218 RepID=UPI000785492B|nr:hypothetical protein [Paenibacillus sp. 32O-W]
MTEDEAHRWTGDDLTEDEAHRRTGDDLTEDEAHRWTGDDLTEGVDGLKRKRLRRPCLRTDTVSR